MVKLFRSTLSLLTQKQTNIISAASVIMTAVAVSRILGLFRDRLLAARFTPSELGIYYAAFRIPNMIFELLVMGALVTAFIPVFTSYLDTKGKKDAFLMASSLINIGILLFAIVSIPILLFSNTISRLIAPGFSKGQIELMTSFTRIMMLGQVCPLIIGNFLTGILQSFRNFIIPSLAPIIYNIGIILSIIFLSPYIGLYAPVFGVVIGAIFFTIIQIPAVKSFKYQHNFVCDFKNSGVKQVGKLMIPRTLGLAVSQIDTTVDLILATLLGASAVTVFNFAQHLQQLPVGLFGASIAQATLPSLSSSFASRKMTEFKEILTSSLHQILFFVIPLSAILIVLRIPMVRLVFGASTLFDWKSTVDTGKTLAFFSISLFAQSLIHLLARGFYALHDTKTPFIIGALSVTLNTLLSLLFVVKLNYGVASLGFSTSVASIVNLTLLLLFFDKKIGGFDRYQLIVPTLKIFLSGLVSGIALYIPIKLLDQLVFDTTMTINLLILTGISTSMGFAVYFFTAWFLEVPQIVSVYRIFQKARQPRRGVIIDTAQEVIDEQQG